MKTSFFAILLVIVMAGVATVASGYKSHKCVHEFVRSEDSVIKIQKYQFDGQDGYYPVGRKNGPMLICIKCYYKTPQILDYGDVNKDISKTKK
jgi:hypothetical protein